ncbi:MAG: S1 RNA-binding domain-containing protein [Pirellulaceae bacterium]
MADAGAERGPLKSWTDKASGGAQPPAVHPEFSEDVAVAGDALPDSVDVEKLARSWQVGREKLRQVASCLHAPFADPRLQNPPVPMMRDMPTLGNLQPGECVWAVVIGVADFGAFVELAPECSGLIHISRLSSHFIEDPHQAVQVGDLVLAWVVSVDEKKNRVALTALSPAQRAAAAALEAERKSEREGQRHRSSGGGGRGGSSHSGERTGAVGSSASSGSGRGSARSDARGGDGRRGAPGGGGSGGRSRGSQPGGRGDGRGDGRGRGRPTHTKTVVVTSKKPKANITAAMKEGEEPLRSFSDLMQFYESKRSDETPPSKQP